MAKTIVEQLADFATDATFDALPEDVVHESKRIILDSVGCALAGLDEDKSRIGLQIADRLGSGSGEATVIGSRARSNVYGAAFANGELINALDYDIVLPPGHVTPYVLPVILALGESLGTSGREIIAANAIAHEISNRFGKAMDYLRDTKDGKVDPPPVFGYSSTIFGAAVAATRLKGCGREIAAHALGIAAYLSPVNPQMAFNHHMPVTTIKYLMAGNLTNAALTAAYSAELGHRGDLQVLDDAEYGYPRFIGTKRWMPERMLDGLGDRWFFPAELSYKPYPHCRVLHALLGCMTGILDKNAISPEEIESIKVSVEGFVEKPIWMNRDITHPVDAQFSIAHGIAVGAHRPPPGKAFNTPEWVFKPSVLDLMQRVTHQVHPDYVKLLTEHGASRPAEIEIVARGQIFRGEQRYPKGVRTPDPDSYMTDAELIEKFLVNADGVLSPEASAEVVEAIMTLETAPDIAPVMRSLARSSPTSPQTSVKPSHFRPNS